MEGYCGASFGNDDTLARALMNRPLPTRTESLPVDGFATSLFRTTALRTSSNSILSLPPCDDIVRNSLDEALALHARARLQERVEKSHQEQTLLPK